MKAVLFLGAFLFGFSSKDVREERAFEVSCPGFTLMAAPADGKVTLDRVSAMSECLGDHASQVCTIQVVKLRRFK